MHYIRLPFLSPSPAEMTCAHATWHVYVCLPAIILVFTFEVLHFPFSIILVFTFEGAEINNIHIRGQMVD
jgi:hypothetical protein